VKCQCLKATVENKTSVTTHFKTLTTENNVVIVSFVVYKFSPDSDSEKIFKIGQYLTKLLGI